MEEFAENAIEMVANDKEMAEKEPIVRQIWQGHPFLEQEKLAKNGKGIANENKEMPELKPNEEPSKKQSLLHRGKHAIHQSIIPKKGHAFCFVNMSTNQPIVVLFR
ncbi:hypothetical protein niasHS_008673 [Heterodera schachtii]|uniref:Uncharacterized protein n=1 Tax=Heterodera schachtii TaxID=97005 RepID=A0ABD2JAV5_HETSC